MDDTPCAQPATRRALDRRIFALAWPALGALIAEPLFVLIDSAVVGHLGTAPLAGLTLASTVLVTCVAIFVFLAYATTAATSRRLGAGDERGALALGIDGIWLALALGVATMAIGLVAAPAIVDALGASASVRPHALAYLRTSLPGIPGMLVVLAATGTLRGLQDTRTPFAVAVGGAIVNTILCVTFVYGLHLGIAGSGLATATTQLGMAAVLGAAVVRGARRKGVALRPAAHGIGASARAGVPLLVRTLALRAAVVISVAVAAHLGDVELAAHQIVTSIWALTVFALDALAIAAQALVGHGLGSGDAAGVRRITARTLRWGALAGAGIGVLLAASGLVLTPLFTPDVAVRHAATIALVVAGALLPLAGFVFVLDGVLIGAGDGRFLAWAALGTLAVFVPLAAAVWAWAPDGGAGLGWLWFAFAGGFMATRAIILGLRARGTRWQVLGAH